jgi:membrane-bound serine protease (ClpP class)
MVLGGLMLVDTPVEMMRVSATVVVPVALATAAITVFLAASVVKAMRGRIQTGAETMAGTEAVARESFEAADGRYQGLVLTHGELWRAVSPTPVTEGDILEVENREGLTLFVNTTGRRNT